MLHDLQKTVRYYLGGIRVYIAFGTILITLGVWWWATTAYSGSSLFSIRLTEIYAWLATAYLASALIIGPSTKVFPKLPYKQVLFDARRLLGVSAAWFASLHVFIAYKVLFKFPNPLSLPASYQRSFALGSVALVILLAMAFTSFDKAFKGMGIWWFRLHRLVYLAVLTGLLHIMIGGSHASNVIVVSILALLTGIITGLHVLVGFKKPATSKLRFASVGCFLVVVLLIFIYGFSHGGIRTTG